jgi:hypothetical protein
MRVEIHPASMSRRPHKRGRWAAAPTGGETTLIAWACFSQGEEDGDWFLKTHAYRSFQLSHETSISLGRPKSYFLDPPFLITSLHHSFKECTTIHSWGWMPASPRQHFKLVQLWGWNDIVEIGAALLLNFVAKITIHILWPSPLMKSIHHGKHDFEVLTKQRSCI